MRCLSHDIKEHRLKISKNIVFDFTGQTNCFHSHNVNMSSKIKFECALFLKTYLGGTVVQP